MWSGQRVLGGLGILLHCSVVALHYFSSGLLAPSYAAYILWALWAASLVLAVSLLFRRPAWAVAVPFVALAVWYGAMGLGS